MIVTVKGWKTRLLGIALGIGGLLQVYQDVIPSEWFGPVMLGLGALVIILREVTDGPPPRIGLPSFTRRGKLPR